jgi:hypothetical protein
MCTLTARYPQFQEKDAEIPAARAQTFYSLARNRNLRDGSEHALVQAEENVRDAAATDGGLGEGFPEAEVGQVAKEGAAGVGEGQGVAPEEPLEGDDGGRHHGQPDEHEGRLAAGETRVEEADAGNHEQHEGRGGDDPCEVARLFTKS